MQHEFVKLMQSLPGHKRLILGNHDHYDIGIYVQAGFQKIRGSNVIDGLLLSHYPIHPGSLPRGCKGNCHGHIHQNPDVSPLHLNISVERTGYEPIPIEHAKKLLEEKQRVAQLAHDGNLKGGPFDVSRNMIDGP